MLHTVPPMQPLHQYQPIPNESSGVPIPSISHGTDRSNPSPPAHLVRGEALVGVVVLLETTAVDIMALMLSASELVGKPCLSAHRFRVRGGFNHFLLVLTFEDGECLLARLEFTREADLHPQEQKEEWKQDTKAYLQNQKYMMSTARGRRMQSEVATLRYLAKYTKVPVPIVYGYDLDLENRIGASYMLQEIIPGTCLDDAWPKMSFEQKLLFSRSLSDVLEELFQLRLPAIGSLYEDQDDPTGFRVGPLAFQGAIQSGDIGPFASCRDLLLAIAQNRLHTPVPENEATRKIRQQLVDRIAAYDGLDDSHPCSTHFALTHPDWYHVNILVDEADPTEITGIVDWDAARVVPAWFCARSLPAGCEEHTTLEQYGLLSKVLDEILAERVPEFAQALQEGQRFRIFCTMCESALELDEEKWSSRKEMFVNEVGRNGVYMGL